MPEPPLPEWGESDSRQNGVRLRNTEGEVLWERSSGQNTPFSARRLGQERNQSSNRGPEAQKGRQGLPFPAFLCQDVRTVDWGVEGGGGRVLQGKNLGQSRPFSNRMTGQARSLTKYQRGHREVWPSFRGLSLPGCQDRSGATPTKEGSFRVKCLDWACNALTGC